VIKKRKKEVSTRARESVSRRRRQRKTDGKSIYPTGTRKKIYPPGHARGRSGRDQRGGVTREYSQDRCLHPESGVHGDRGADYRGLVLVIESRHIRYFVLRRF